MGIALTKIRISNFRSIELLSLELGISNLLIGQNNSGKTNFLRAIDIALSGSMDVSEDDIYVANGERLDRTKTAIIDIMLQPVDGNSKVQSKFNEHWTDVFTVDWINTSAEGSFVGIRTVIQYDVSRDAYVTTRRRIMQWADSVAETTVENKRVAFNEDMRNYIQTHYLNAHRDIVEDLRNRRSYFGRVTSDYDISDEMKFEIEKQLSDVNAMIIENNKSLQQTKKRISAIGETIGDAASNVEIEPIARKLSDLSRGMDIIMKDGAAAPFPISRHGSGTRSWISFLTLAAFVENQNEKLRTDDDAEQYFVLTMEEPEAHLHPQAQRQLFEQISDFPGQRIVSTHSPYLITQSALEDVICFSKREGKTIATHYEADVHISEAKLFREVINTRADILFASVIILCEGITEELVLPVFFRERFGCSPFAKGVTIVNVGGYKNYKPFLSLAKQFNIRWVIFSDGEAGVVESVKSDIESVFATDIEATPMLNIITIENGDDYEKHLIHSGYSDLIIEAICEIKDDETFFDRYIAMHHGKPKGKNKPNRDYEHENGREEALINLTSKNKPEYGLPVALKLIGQANESRRIPPAVVRLFSVLVKELGEENSASEEGVR